MENVFLGEDSDSECETSSTEDGVSPQSGGGHRGVGGGAGPQKRPRKKPAPQVPRSVAIPVAVPKVPSVIPPRQPPPRPVAAAVPGPEAEVPTGEFENS